MLGPASLQIRNASSSLGLPGMLLLVVLALPIFGSAQQPPATRHSTPPPARIASPLQEAETLIQQGLFEQAKEEIQEQIKLNPANLDAYNLLGIACTYEKDYADASDAFQQALQLAPDSTVTHNNLGNLYVAQQKIDLAEKEFTKVLSVAPANRDANYNLGLLLMAKGEPAAAIRYLQRVRPLTVEPQLNLVRAYLQAGRTSDALRTARQVSAENKKDVQLHFTLGVLLASERQYKAAQLELEQANALQPETFEILYNLGQAYLRGGENAKADLALNRAIKLKPETCWRRLTSHRRSPWTHSNS